MKLYIGLIGIIIFVAIGFFVLRTYKVTKTDTNSSSLSTTEQQEVLPTETTPQTKSSQYFYPITRYESRITNRDHGKSTTLSDSKGFSCGGQFEGIHVGDDLEVSKEELPMEVPVYAIAEGKIRQASTVNGYGGLLITEHTINGQEITIYYGHVDLSQLKYKSGESIKAGAILTYLGNNCSSETSNERKHLHFDIHKGNSIDVRGYVKTLGELSFWVDPTEFLKSLNPKEPGIN